MRAIMKVMSLWHGSEVSLSSELSFGYIFNKISSLIISDDFLFGELVQWKEMWPQRWSKRSYKLFLEDLDKSHIRMASEHCLGEIYGAQKDYVVKLFDTYVISECFILVLLLKDEQFLLESTVINDGYYSSLYNNFAMKVAIHLPHTNSIPAYQLIDIENIMFNRLRGLCKNWTNTPFTLITFNC